MHKMGHTSLPPRTNNQQIAPKQQKKYGSHGLKLAR
jgi:hypothetical protein